MIPSFNNLIIFKNDGTWRFTYASDPAGGSVDKISGSVGCASKNAVVDFENYLYVYDQGRVYELVNSGFARTLWTLKSIAADIPNTVAGDSKRFWPTA